MVFPASFLTILLVAIFGSLALGLWTITTKLAGKWRFELYCIDFAVGVIAAALAIGFTLGTMGNEITFFDNLNICRKSSLGFLFGAGALLNLGMMLLVGAIGLAGITVPSVMSLGLAAAVALLGMHLVKPLVSGWIALGVVATFGFAAVLAARAFMARLKQRDLEALQKAIGAGAKVKPPRSSPWKAILLSLFSGLLIGLAWPLIEWTQSRDEISFGGYSAAFMIALAVFLTTPFFELFFVNLPIQGDPLSLRAYRKGTLGVHLTGAFGGAVWYIGILCCLLAAGAPAEHGFQGQLAFAINRGSIVFAALVGLLYAGDFASAPGKARSLAFLAVAICLAALAVVALSPAPVAAG